MNTAQKHNAQFLEHNSPIPNEVDGFTVLHSGHNLPGPGNVLQCGKGVAVVLNPVLIMTQAWHDVWFAVNSRIVSVYDLITSIH